MKIALSISLIIASVTLSWGQDTEHFLSGTISYKNTQNIYVKFKSTEFIKVDDTIFIQVQNQYVPALIVKHISSISCVCTPITDEELNIIIETTKKCLDNQLAKVKS